LVFLELCVIHFPLTNYCKCSANSDCLNTHTKRFPLPPVSICKRMLRVLQVSPAVIVTCS